MHWIARLTWPGLTDSSSINFSHWMSRVSVLRINSWKGMQWVGKKLLQAEKFPFASSSPPPHFTDLRNMVCLCLVTRTRWFSCGALWCVSNMAGSLSSSMEGTGFSDSDMSADESTSSVAHREKNLMSLLKQENRVLKMELETCKLRCKQLQEENRALRQASVSIVSWVLNL